MTDGPFRPSPFPPAREHARRRFPLRRGASARDRGSAGVEYTLVTFAVIVSLFVAPVTPAGDTAVGWVLKALRLFQDHTTYLLSLP